MKRWHKAVIAGGLAGSGMYALDSMVISKSKPHRYTMAIVPGAIAAVAAGIITYIVAPPGPGEAGLLELSGWSDSWDRYQAFPPSYVPRWTYVEGVNLPQIRLPDGAAGVMNTY
jgi:hypothetical protein